MDFLSYSVGIISIGDMWLNCTCTLIYYNQWYYGFFKIAPLVTPTIVQQGLGRSKSNWIMKIIEGYTHSIFLHLLIDVCTYKYPIYKNFFNFFSFSFVLYILYVYTSYMQSNLSSRNTCKTWCMNSFLLFFVCFIFFLWTYDDTINRI